MAPSLPRRSGHQGIADTNDAPARSPVRTLLIILAIIVAAVLVYWLIVTGQRRERQRAFDAAGEAKAKALDAIAQADVKAYQLTLQPITRLRNYSGHQIDGRDLGDISNSYQQELHTKAIEALPRFVARLEKDQDRQQFWAITSIVQQMDEEARKRWQREALPLYEKYAPDSAESMRKFARAEEKRERQARRKELQATAVLADSYTFAAGVANEAISLNDDHFREISELLLDHLSMRLEPICLLPRQAQATTGGKGHIQVIIAGGYAIYERTHSPLAIPMRTNSVPEEFLIEVTFKRPGVEPISRKLHAKKEAPQHTKSLTTVFMRSEFFDALFADLERQIKEMPLP